MPGQQWFGDKALIFNRPRAHAQIETVPRQIPVAVVQLQLDLDLRIALSELQQHAIEEGFPQGNRHRHAHRPRQVVLESRQGLTRPLHLHHQGLGLR